MAIISFDEYVSQWKNQSGSSKELMLSVAKSTAMSKILANKLLHPYAHA